MILNKKMPYMAYFNLKSGIWIFFIAFLVRVSYVFFFIEPEYLLIDDQAGYIQLAQHFPNSGFLGVIPERVPGYPLFMASIYTLFGDGSYGVIAIQILLDSISCVVIALMAHSFLGSRFWIAGTLAAVNLNMVTLSASILTDTLFLFLFVLFLFSLLKYIQSERTSWIFPLVLFLSLATLVRAASYYLLPILLIWLVGWRLYKKDSIFKIGKLMALYLVTVGISLGGIHQRNYQQYESTAFVAQTGAAVIGWIVPATYQYSGQGSYQEGLQLGRERLALALQRDHLTNLSKNPFESSAYRTNVGTEILLEFGFLNILKAWASGSIINMLTPSAAFTPALRSMKHPSFYKTEGNGIVEKLFNYIKNSSGFLYLSILAVGTIISIIFTMLALVGVFKMITALPPITATTLLLLVGYFFAITGPIIGVKYRLPIEPILILFVTYFLNRINRKDY
jgi:hypothetical protein